MSTRSKPRCVDALAFLRANGERLSVNGGLGILTGQDARALLAIAHAWDLYFVSDQDGRHAALGAVRHLLNAMQRKCWPFARELIAFAGDWSDVDRLWAEVLEGELYAAGEDL